MPGDFHVGSFLAVHLNAGFLGISASAFTVAVTLPITSFGKSFSSNLRVSSLVLSTDLGFLLAQVAHISAVVTVVEF